MSSAIIFTESARWGQVTVSVIPQYPAIWMSPWLTQGQPVFPVIQSSDIFEKYYLNFEQNGKRLASTQDSSNLDFVLGIQLMTPRMGELFI